MADFTSAISLKGVGKAFGETAVLHGIDLEISEGEVVCVIGPSGSGKSTLLRCIAFLEEPVSGVAWQRFRSAGYPKKTQTGSPESLPGPARASINSELTQLVGVGSALAVVAAVVGDAVLPAGAFAGL